MLEGRRAVEVGFFLARAAGVCLVGTVWWMCSWVAFWEGKDLSIMEQVQYKRLKVKKSKLWAKLFKISLHCLTVYISDDQPATRGLRPAHRSFPFSPQNINQ